MKNNELFQRIRANYTEFTKAETKVADYVLQNPGKVVYMSIVDLSDACQVGDTSVFRFCKKLKFQGYQDFKLQLAQNIAGGQKDNPQLLGDVSLDDPVDIVVRKLLETTIGALRETSQFINPESVSKAVDYMIAADRILFLGVGASMITAAEAKSKFVRITRKVGISLDSHSQAMEASLLTDRDVAVAISYSGSTKDTIKLAQISKEAGARVICITRFPKSPLVSYSDVVLLCGANESPFQSGSLSAKISQLYLLDVLYTEYFIRTWEKSTMEIQKTARSVLDKLY